MVLSLSHAGRWNSPAGNGQLWQVCVIAPDSYPMCWAQQTHDLLGDTHSSQGASSRALWYCATGADLQVALGGANVLWLHQQFAIRCCHHSSPSSSFPLHLENSIFNLQGFVPGSSIISPALFLVTPLAPHAHLIASSLWAFVPAVPSTPRPHQLFPAPIPPHPPKLSSRVTSSKKPSRPHLSLITCPLSGFPSVMPLLKWKLPIFMPDSPMAPLHHFRC